MWRDLWGARGRTLLVVAAIVVGVAAVGSQLTAYSVLSRELDRSLDSTHPAAATLEVDRADPALVDAIAARPDVAAATRRREVAARLRTGPDEWTRLRLLVVDDPGHDSVARVFREDGELPGPGEIAIERASLRDVALAPGDIAHLRVGTRPRADLRVSGTVHDPAQTPAWISGQVIAYARTATLADLGLEPVLDRLLITAAEDGARAEMAVLAADVRADVEARGITVRAVDVPEPGVHPFAEGLDTLLYLLRVLAVTALVVSGVLVASLVGSLMRQQLRQIGVMKALGATRAQVARSYAVTAVVLGSLGFVVGLPLGWLAGRAFTAFAAGVLNVEIASHAVAPWVVPAQLVVALGIPLAAAVVPIVKASRVPVREVLVDHGIPPTGAAARPRRLLAWPGPAVLLGLRNVSRARSRTAWAVVALSLGGAAFMAALNTGASWDRTVDGEFDVRDGAVVVVLDRPYPESEVAAALAGPDLALASWQGWRQVRARVGVEPDPSAADAILLQVPPDGTAPPEYPLEAGRWLRPDDDRALVVSNRVEGVDVGDEVRLDVDADAASWTVVGVVRRLGPASAYASHAPAGVDPDVVDMLRLLPSASPERLARAAESTLVAADVGVVDVSTAADEREVYDDHFVIIVGLLLTMAVLVAVVGGLGLMETMGVAVLERRREIGVMRAIGASTRQVLRVLVTEAASIALLGWALAVVLSVPLTLLLTTVTGSIFAGMPLAPAVSAAGVGLWLLLSVLVAVVACAVPALEAADLPVHDALAYE